MLKSLKYYLVIMIEESLAKLLGDLRKFKYLLEPNKYEIILNNIRGTYLFKKPIFSIVLNTADYDIAPFIDCMNNYFFTEFDKNHSDKIFISRFKNFFEIAQEHRELLEILRFLYGHSLKEVFDYCAKNKPRLVKLKHSNSNELEKDLINFKYLFEANYENVQKEVIGKDFIIYFYESPKQLSLLYFNQKICSKV